MHLIEFFIESHWEIERPNLNFFLNQTHLTNGHRVLYEKVNRDSEKLIYKFLTSEISEKNEIIVNLSGKTHELTTEQCDHWVEIKNIAIDGIYADWLIYTDTKFIHTMPSDWVDDIKSQGIEILDEYSPGTEMRLNGNMFFYFDSPFWLHKTKEIERR